MIFIQKHNACVLSKKISVFRQSHLFFANSLLSGYSEKPLFGNTTTNSVQLPQDVTGNIIDLYWSKSSKYQCKTDFFSNYTNTTIPSEEDIVEHSLIYYLPELVRNNGLNHQEIFFLERIGDFVNRGSVFFAAGTKDMTNEKHAEYIVRLPEFIVAGLNDEILGSMSKAKEFWQQYISPNVQQETDAYYEKYANQMQYCNRYIVTDSECYLNQTQPEVLGDQPEFCFNI